MYVSVNGCAFWLPSTLQQQWWEKKKKKWTNHSLLFNASAVCWNMSCHLFHHHPGADSARAQVRPEQHTLISVFKLNSCKLCQLKHLRARGRELARAVRRFVRALIRSAQTRTSERAQIWSSLWSIVFEWTNSHKNSVKMPILVSILADIAGWMYWISALDQCILLKWQHFLNINQTATTKKSLTALDGIAFVTLIKINL